jgi:HlyD family secretion protein
MLKLLKELFNLLTDSQKKRFYRLQLLVVFSAFAEIIGIASIAPFMSLISDLTLLENNSFLSNLFSLSGLETKTDFIFWVGIAVLLSLIFSTLISMLATKKLAMFAAKVGTENADRLFKHYLNQDWLFHSSGSSAQLIKQIANEAVRVTDLVILPMILMIAKIVMVFFLLTAIIVYDPIVAVSGFFMFSICYFIVFSFAKSKLSENGKTLSEVATERYRLMNEAFGGIKDVLILNRRNSFINRFEEAGNKFAYARGNNHVLWQVPRYFMELIAFGSMISTILILIVIDGSNINELIPVFSVYVLAAFKLLPAFQQIYASVGQIKGNIAAFESIHEDLLDSQKEIIKASSNKQNFDHKKIHLTKNISLSNISFCYPGKTKPAIENLSMIIPAKSVVGIVGPSGSGKSTLIDVILALISPQQGSIKVDDKLLNNENIYNWQKNIGFVAQSIFLSEGSIAENIAFGLPNNEIDFNKIDEVLKLANLEELVKSLDYGINTKVGERGVQLSGGQRQRIGIARALYHETEIFIFDEATSSLDGITEKLIMDAINEFRGDKTIIIVAHRLKTIRNCDCIFYIDNGELVHQGTYDQLIKENINFRKMAFHA